MTTTDETPDAGPMPTLPASFYNTPTLEHLRSCALQRVVSPDAVLHAVLARVAAFSSPDLVLPPIVGTRSPLNYFVAVVGRSGVGKSASARVAKYLVPPPLHLLDRDDVPVGSGEGLVESFFEKDIKTKEKIQVHQNLYLYVDEGEVFKRLGSREGTTLDTVIRSAFSGDVLGQRNANKATSRMLPANSYSLALVVGYQPSHAAYLLDQVGGGTPQRFVWASAGISPDDSKDAHDAWGMNPYPALHLLPYEDRTGEIGFPDAVADQLVADSWLANIGQLTRQPMDSHSPLLRMRMSALMALLDGRKEVTVKDWNRSLAMLNVSQGVRAWVHQYVAAQQEIEHRKVLSKDADRARAQTHARDTLGDYQQGVERRVLTILKKHGEDGLALGKFQNYLSAGQMSVLDSVLKALLERKEIEPIHGTKRVRWIDPTEWRVELVD